MSRSPQRTGLDSRRRLPMIIGKLDPTVGRSGPHDFVVRIGALVSRAAASIASHITLRDDWP
jgi:hypothetical protein